MNLLQDIKDAINHSDTNISDILRKALELGYVLSNKELVKWAECELEGYTNDDVPAYRIIHAESIGDFAGMFGREAKNMPIPSLNLPEIVKKFAEYTEIGQGVSALQCLIDSNQRGSLTIKWPANYIALSQDCIYQQLSLISAHKLIPVASIVLVLDQVKTRLLKFVLEIQKSHPDVKSEEDLKSLSTDDVLESYHKHISGSVNCSKE